MAGDDCQCPQDLLNPDYCCPSCGKDYCGTCEDGMLHGSHEDGGGDDVCEECCNEQTGCPDLKDAKDDDSEE